MTNNLLRTELAPGQTANQYATVNTSDGDIDSAITKRTAVLVSTTSPVVINRATLTKSIELALNNHGTPPIANFAVTLDNETATVPYPRGLIIISNNTSFLATISSINQTLPAVEIEAGTSKLCYLDTNNVQVVTAESIATFLDLLDTPDSYAGTAGYAVQVNAAGNALSFRDLSQGVVPTINRWRVLVSASNDATPFLSIGDIEFREFVGVPETMTTVGGVATASAPFFGGDPATLLFNGLTNVRYAFDMTGGFGAGKFAEFNFTTARQVRQLCMKAPDAFFGEMAKDFVVQYWDGVAWQTVLTVTNATAWGSGESRTYDINYTGGFREKLSTARTYYVRSDGNDANSGLTDNAAGAFLTLQAAVDAVYKLDLNGNAVTIQARTHTYTAGVVLRGPFVGDYGLPPLVTLVGDTATPANCHINVAAGNAIVLTHGARLNLGGGFKLTAPGIGVSASQHSYIGITGAMEYAACGTHIFVQSYSIMVLQAAYTISGGATSHWRYRSNGQIQTGAAFTITLTGTPAFSLAFLNGEVGGGFLALVFGVTFSGAATGRRYIMPSSAFISAQPTIDLDSYFPGDVQGSILQNYMSLTGIKNLLINPSGRIQDGAAGSIADGAYGLHNCWYALTQSNPITPSGLADVADGVPSMIRLTQANAAAQRMGYSQIIEGANCKHLRGRKVSISGKVRCSQAITIRWAVIEWTGTENAPTKDVVNNWASVTFTAGNFFISLSVIITHTGSLALSANTLTHFSAASFLLGSTFNNLYVVLWTNSTLAQNETFDLLAQLEEGDQFTRMERRPIQLDRAMTRRYYEAKTVQSENGSRHIPLWPKLTTPAVTVGVGSAGNITPDGFELTHTSAAACTVVADSNMGV